MDPVVDRPPLNTKWLLPNSTIVLSMWFTIRSNRFTVWDISFILQMLLHSSMIPLSLNSSLNLHEYGMAYASIISFILQMLLHSSMIPLSLNSSLNLHEYGMAYVSTASIVFSTHTILCSIIFYHTSI